MKNENLKTELKEVLNNRKTLGQSNNVRTSPLSVGDTILISAKTCSREKTAPLNGNIYQYFAFTSGGNSISEKHLIANGNGLNFIEGTTYEERLTSLIEFIDENEAVISISKIKVTPSSFSEGKDKFYIFNVDSISELEEEDDEEDDEEEEEPQPKKTNKKSKKV